MKIIVVGCGSIGKRHIGNLIKIVDTGDVFAVDPNLDRLKEVQAKFNIKEENTFASVDDAIAKHSFTAAVIASPTSFHHLDIIKMANHGAHLMIEKPLSVDLSSIEEVRKAVVSSKKFAFTAYCFRFDPVANKFQELIKSNFLGKPLYARAEMSTYLPDWHPYEDYRNFYMSKKNLGGGTLLDQSHLYDMALWFFGDIESVYGITKKHSYLEMDTDDFGEFIFNSKSGLNISVHIDLFTKKFREFFQVTCENGTLNWDIGQRTIYAEFDNKKEVLAQGDNYNLMYINEINYFIDQIKNNGTLPGPCFEEGFKVMEVIEAIRKSDKSQKLHHL